MSGQDESGLASLSVDQLAAAAPRAALAAGQSYTQELIVRRDEVCDWGIRFERLRHKVPLGWISTVAWLLLGTGLGVWAQNGKMNTGALICFVAGGMLLVGLSFAHGDRVENLNNLCDDFLRFVDKWEPMDGHDKNSAYVLAVVGSDRQASLTRLGQAVRKLRIR